MAEIHRSTSQRNNDKLSYCGFIYNRERMRGNTTYWKCVQRAICSGRVNSVLNDGKLDVQLTREHAHGPQPKQVALLRIKSRIKRKAMEQPEATPGELVTQEFENLSTDERLSLPEIDNLCRMVNRVRGQSLQWNVSANAADLQISTCNLRTISGKQFLLHDNIIRNEVDQTTQRTIIFATKSNLRYLFASEIWYVNGTFQIAPTKFLQLWTIHGKVTESVVPLVYILMQTKREEEYLEILVRLKYKAMELKIFDKEPSVIMVDCIKSAVKALKRVFPNAQLYMCMIHFKQALYNKIQDFSLLAEYSQEDGAVKHWLCCVIGLAYVPPADVIEVFELLLKELDSDENGILVRLKAVAQYLDRNYLRGQKDLNGIQVLTVRYPIEMWNAYERTLRDDVRTDSVFEEWHNGFNRTVHIWRATMNALVGAIRKEQDYSEGTLKEIFAGQRNVRQPVMKRTAHKDQCIRNFVMRYKEFKIAGRVLEYIKTVGSYNVP